MRACPLDQQRQIELNTTLLNVQNICDYLDQNTILATEYLQFIGTYPYDPEPSFPHDEDLPSTSYGSPEHVPYMWSSE